MRLKGFHPHKGRAFLEVDARVADFIRAAAVLNRVKQDEVLAVSLLTGFEEDKDGPMKEAYDKLAVAYNAGEFKRKQFKRPPAIRIETKREVEEGPEQTELGPVPPEMRAEWDDFIKASS